MDDQEQDQEEVNKDIDMDRKKILSILSNNLELQGEIYIVKLYSSDRGGEDWLYSGLEGYFCFILDYSLKTKYFIIYDPTTYQKVFQYELYNNFGKFYEELAPDFRSLEIESGFIGLQFTNEENAKEFDLVVQRYSAFNNDIFSKAKSKDEKSVLKDKAALYCKELKKNFCEDDNKYDEKYAEDGTQILKHRNFKVLSNISYDKETKKFQFGKISDELKEMFVSFGIKKKDLESDVDFAFTLFKQVIVGLGTENKLKNSALQNIEHSFPPPEERKRLQKQEEENEQKLNKIKTKREQTKRKAVPKPKNNKTKAPISNKKAGGAPPPPPPPPPMIASTAVKPVVSTSTPVTKKVEESNVQSNNDYESDMAKQLQGVKLKKVVVAEKAPDKNIQGTGKNFLQNALSTAIKNRRNNLHMHDDEDDDEDDDDWD